MGMNIRHRLRRFAALLALVGTMACTGLVPWHSSSQLAAYLLHSEFTVRVDIPEGVTQHRENGELNWTQIPAPGQDAHQLNARAPALRLAGGVTETGSTPSRFSIGDLVIEQPWARATPGGATVGAGYLKILNTGKTSDTLMGGGVSFADKIEVHEMTSADGVMKMRALADGLVIQPGATVELAPGATHLMLLGLRVPLKAGQPFKATLNFKNAGAVEVEFPVRPIGAEAPRGSHP